MKTQYIHGLLSALLFISCSREKQPIEVSTDLLHECVKEATEIMIHDIFSPPVASRVFAYPNIAAYEIVASTDPNYKSLSGQLNGLEPIPQPEVGVNTKLAAIMAHLELTKKLIFSEDRITSIQDSLFTSWESQNEEEFLSSKDYAMQVVKHMLQWMDQDSYKQTRTMPKFTVNTDDPSRWQPTPPMYMDGIEPHWNKIRPFVLDSASQFKPVPPPSFSLEPESQFYKELKEVYDVSVALTEEGDDSEGIAMARFWDCNPYVSVTRGHLMFATKKITPGAHWMGICKIASQKSGADFRKTLMAYTLTSIGLMDAFISCWDEKYRSNLIRPETLINAHIDENWQPILQTPPFPEYSSGHSVVSGASSVILTSIFGDNFAFEDDTEVPYGLPVRSFTSFTQAAEEAALSRMYGGIHYRAAIENGLQQGLQVGNYIVNQIQLEEAAPLAQQ